MDLFEYKDYEHYKKSQVDANLKKFKFIWVSEDTCKHVHAAKPDAKTVLCHGCRNGAEIVHLQKLFGEGVEVIGTDISHTANDVEDMVEWDFHKVNEEWVGKFDLLYSNSFDHSYDPETCLDTWIGQLNENGVLCIELMVGINNASTEMDPLKLNLEEFKKMVEARGYKVDESLLHTTKGDIHDYEGRLTVSRRI